MSITGPADDIRDRENASIETFVEAAIRYRPDAIKFLLIAEAPPALRFNRFFYFEDLRNGDTLFLEMMKTLYGEAVGFAEAGFLPGTCTKSIRTRKSELLTRFKSDGYFLIDASEEPMPDRATSPQKGKLLRASLPRLVRRLKELRIEQSTPIILIGGVTYSVCAQPLRDLGFNIINQAMIDHPARGGQIRFRRKLRSTLAELKYMPLLR